MTPDESVVIFYMEIDLKIFSFYHKCRYNVVEMIGNYSYLKSS